MGRALALFAAGVLLTGACGADAVVGPFDELPLDSEIILPPDAGLLRPVHVARDRYGLAHINAETLSDAAFVQGYVMAHDRLPQMDILRRFGAGTLAELFGTLDPTVINTDLEMRVHRMKPLAQQTWDMLQASADPIDQQLVTLLQRYADGVNRYAVSIITDTNPTGMWKIDKDILASFDPTRFVPWTPVDSLVLGRFQAFALSWSTPFELELSELYQDLQQTFDQSTAADPPAIFARKGISRDIMRLAPVGKVSTIDGFPNLDTDTGSRSNGSGPPARTAPPAGAAAQVGRPTVPRELFAQARAFFRKGIHTGPNGALGPQAFMHPFAGSNNWAVGPSRTGDDSALLATDQHLQLPNPSIFYPTHLMIAETGTDLLGVTFPGIPGVILGTNGAVAWSATVSEHDVNDIYLETIAPCAQGSCAMFNGNPVPIQTFTETIDIGTLGSISDHRTVTYEVVPHHGPIIPKIDPIQHTIIPRTASTAMSVRYTGYEPSFEIRALWKLGHAADVAGGFKALTDFSYGSQNWTMIDQNLNVGWSTHARVPVRDPRAYTWNAQTNPGGLAPFFVLPGDGTAEWQGELSPRYIPHAVNPPPPHDYIATANADPVGATFDGDALNQRAVDGRPLYVGVSYAAGVREERISQLIEQRGVGITIEDMARIQHDTRSNVAAKLLPAIRIVLARLDSPAGAPADAIAYLGGLSMIDRGRLAAARDLLEPWTFATAIGNRAESAATSVFNVWMHFALTRTLSDEMTAMGLELFDLDDNFLFRIVYALLTDPGSFVQSPTTQQPILCDEMSTPGDDSCTKVILEAMVDAMAHLESAFPGARPADYDWGQLHRLKINPLFPNTALSLPKGDEPGFPKAGDMFAINRADTSWSGLNFSQSADGPAQRFLATARLDPFGLPQPIKVKWALPGGVIYDPSSRHYRDLLDDYYLAERHFDAPYSVAEINAAGENRWVFR